MTKPVINLADVELLPRGFRFVGRMAQNMDYWEEE